MNFKSSNVIFISCLMISLPYCVEPEPNYGPFFNDYYGNSSFTLNGNLYTSFPYADTSALFPGTFDLSLLYYNDYYHLESVLIISSVPLIKGRYEFKSSDSGAGLPACYFRVSLYDADVADSAYKHDSTLRFSYIDVTEIDSISGEIAGDYNIQFKRVYLYIESPEYPDTLNIVGNYYTKLGYEE